MQSFEQDNTPCAHPNAFTALFLGRLAERDEPPTAGDADVAGPSRIESPESLAYLLEAAGAVALERCGATLDEQLDGPGSATGE